ncbi:hypothetical protein AQJ11_37720 [Streptomyces corchorusii]|uniref:HTH luxR-type domain-containing protein n=2 Tax=Streptomyces TaxID=1883 RepID=A0A117QAK4_STRCK|nr:hypothetical protein [Streptomyces corchorusii]KUN17604.1 hypothetical protein AQJ11_37720 [Streptomyces corchorusii]
MTTTGTSAQLSPTQRRVALHLVWGIRPDDIAGRLHLKPETVQRHIRSLRALLGCPPRALLHVLVHALLASGQFQPPAPQGNAPDLPEQDIEVLCVLARHSNRKEAACAAGLTPGALERRIRALKAAARAQDETDLIIWAHSWTLLNAATAPGETSR